MIGDFEAVGVGPGDLMSGTSNPAAAAWPTVEWGGQPSSGAPAAAAAPASAGGAAVTPSGGGAAALACSKIASFNFGRREWACLHEPLHAFDFVAQVLFIRDALYVAGKPAAESSWGQYHPPALSAVARCVSPRRRKRARARARPPGRFCAPAPARGGPDDIWDDAIFQIARAFGPRAVSLLRRYVARHVSIPSPESDDASAHGPAPRPAPAPRWRGGGGGGSKNSPTSSARRLSLIHI